MACKASARNQPAERTNGSNRRDWIARNAETVDMMFAIEVLRGEEGNDANVSVDARRGAEGMGRGLGGC